MSPRRLIPIALCTLAAAGCGGGDEPRPRAAAGDALQNRLNLSVVAIDARIGSDVVRSSGTVIDADRGLVLTTAHSVWGATEMKVTTGLGVLHGRIVARGPCDDLALLETQPRLPGLGQLAGAGGGGGEGAPNMLLTGVGRRSANADYGAAGLLEIPVRAQPTGTRTRLAVPLLTGALALDSTLVGESTGGPIIDRQGRPVAMIAVTADRDGRVAAAGLPWELVQAKLDQLRPGPRTVYVGWRSQYRCVQRLHDYARAAHPGFDPRAARLTEPPSVSRLPGTEELDR
jgi:hypothetical protein